MSPFRCTVLRGGALFALGAPLVTPLTAQITAQDEVVELWPGRPPGSRGTTIARNIDDQSHDLAHPDRRMTSIARPVRVVRRPARPDGTAVLVMPGGGYKFLFYDNEGTSQAAWLNTLDITAFILFYRLPGAGWNDRGHVPLQDDQRPMCFMRGCDTSLGIRADRIEVLGFSAGGHLAGSLATRHAETMYVSVDAYDQESARPDIAALIYPVSSLAGPYTHGSPRDMLLGPDGSEAVRRLGSVKRRINDDTRPTFLVYTADDDLVPPANRIAMFAAMTESHCPVALHFFEDGGHGFGTCLPKNHSAMTWPRLFVTFATRHGLLK